MTAEQNYQEHIAYIDKYCDASIAPLGTPAELAAEYGAIARRMIDDPDFGRIGSTTNPVSMGILWLHARIAAHYGNVVLGDTLCAHCDKRPATRFTEPKSQHDQTCEECFVQFFTECERCSRTILKTDVVSICVSRQTRWEPAEYENACISCSDGSER